MSTRWRRSLVVVAVVASLEGGCGSGDDAGDGRAAPGATVTETTSAPGTTSPAESAEDTTTTRPGSTPGLDDLNQDGQPEPTCGTRDFGAGLVLRIPCDAAAYANEPSEGTSFVSGSLYELPAIPDELKEKVLVDVSANSIRARDAEGRQVFGFFIKSDTLFEVGSSSLSNPAKETLAGLARNIQGQWPTASVQVRGHTDATGSAPANQRLSEQRASTVADFLDSRGIDRARLTSVGLGSTAPIVLEKNPDGSDNPAGRAENRRVELVVRVP